MWLPESRASSGDPTSGRRDWFPLYGINLRNQLRIGARPALACYAVSMPWEERARKLEKKKRRMVVQGRGLITVEPLATSKRLKQMGDSARARRKRSKH